MAVVRLSALLLLLFLLLDPRVPGTGAEEGEVWVVVDGSLGMSAPDGEGRSAWDRAVERAAEEDGRLALFDGAFRSVSRTGLEDHEPERPWSELAGGLRSALEAGAREVVVMSDLRIRDRASVRRVLEEAGVPVRFEDLSHPVRNAGILEARFPGSLSSDEPVEVEVDLFGESGEAGDSVHVEVREEDRVVGGWAFALPNVGERIRRSLELPPPESEGLVRYEVRTTLEGDAFPWDDVRVEYREVDPEEGVILLSLRPDWEPRVLLPALRRATGIEGAGFLALSEGRFLPLAVSGDEGTETVDESVVRESLGQADLVVLHGVEEGAPEWLEEVAQAAPRLLVLPYGSQGAALAEVQAEGPDDGEWYLDGEVPSSPVAPYFPDPIPGVNALPPLGRALSLSQDPEGAVPLTIRRDRRGAARPLFLLRQDGERRVALALASGFWRWAMRPQEGRDVYRRLWAGISAWLLEDEIQVAGMDVRPEERVAPWGEPVAWRAMGWEGQELALDLERLREGEVADVMERVVEVGQDGRFSLEVPESGTYRYRVLEGSDGEEVVVGEGRFDVLRTSTELSVSPVGTEELLPEGEDWVVSEARASPGFRLRTHPGPWVLLISLLCLEWVGRRRVGLR